MKGHHETAAEMIRRIREEQAGGAARILREIEAEDRRTLDSVMREIEAADALVARLLDDPDQVRP